MPALQCICYHIKSLSHKVIIHSMSLLLTFIQDAFIANSIVMSKIFQNAMFSYTLVIGFPKQKLQQV